MLQSLLRSPLSVAAPAAPPAARGSLAVVASTRPQWKVREGGERAGGVAPNFGGRHPPPLLAGSRGRCLGAQ